MGIIDGIKKLEQGLIKLATKIKNAVKFLMSSIRNGSRASGFSSSCSNSCISLSKNF